MSRVEAARTSAEEGASGSVSIRSDDLLFFEGGAGGSEAAGERGRFLDFEGLEGLLEGSESAAWPLPERNKRIK